MKKKILIILFSLLAAFIALVIMFVAYDIKDHKEKEDKKNCKMIERRVSKYLLEKSDTLPNDLYIQIAWADEITKDKMQKSSDTVYDKILSDCFKSGLPRPNNGIFVLGFDKTEVKCKILTKTNYRFDIFGVKGKRSFEAEAKTDYKYFKDNDGYIIISYNE